jgi:O-antigen ligase
VLDNKWQPIRLSDIRWAHISLILVGLMWVFPFLHYRHENPLTSFDQEWWSAVLGLCSLTLLTLRDFWKKPEIPRVAQLPAALIAVLLLQVALNKIVYFEQALLYAMYFAFAALLMVLGARLRDYFGLTRLSLLLAIFLLIGAVSSAVIGVLQHFRWHTLLDSVIVMKVSSGVYGNLAQPNHFADYIAMGLISLGLLFQQDRFKSVYLVVLVAVLLFVMTLSGSRSSWLYLLMMSVLAWWMARRDAGLRPLLSYSLSLVAGFALMHLVVLLPFLAGAENTPSTNTVVRLYRELLSNDAGVSSTVWMHFYMLHEAWMMFVQSPWLGVGFGQFAWQHFQLLPELRANYIFGFYNNAHNMIFQLAAETGSAGLLALLGSMAVWLSGIYKRYAISIRKTFVPALDQANSMGDFQKLATLSAAHWWGYAVLGVLAIHSTLEYPLWYAYLLAIAAILLGAFDETRYRLSFHNAGRYSLIVILMLGSLSLFQLRFGYQKLKDTLAMRIASGNNPEASQLTRNGLIDGHGELLLSPYVDLYNFMYTEVNADNIKQKLALGSNVMRFAPIAPVLYRQIFLLGLDGQQEQGNQLLVQAIWSYPANVEAHRKLVSLAEKDPAQFSALLEFANQQEQEHARAVRQ